MPDADTVPVTTPQLLYGALAVLGVVGPWYFNLQMEDLSQFFSLMWATPLTSSLGMDLTAVVGALYVFMFTEGRRVGLRAWVLAALAVLTWVVAVGFTWPFFLLLRERAQLRLDAAPPP